MIASLPAWPPHLLFSLLSVCVTGGLLLLSLLRPNRRGGWAFRLLTAALTCWQWAEFSKNGLSSGDTMLVEGWTRVSFACVSLVAPTFLWMALRMAARPMRRWAFVLGAAYGLAFLLVLLDSQGFVLGRAMKSAFGTVHEARWGFGLFAASFVWFNGLALYVLYRGAPGYPPAHRRLRLLFWAAALGLGLGLGDVATVLWKPLFPVANLSAALYALVLYWAIFRYNYLGGRSLLREIALHLACGLLALAFGGLLYRTGSWLSSHPASAEMGLLLGALAIALSAPSLARLLRSLYRRRFPASQKGSDLLLAVSRSSGSTEANDLLKRAIAQISSSLSLKGGYALWKKTGESGWEAVDAPLPPHVLPLLDRQWHGSIGKRFLRERLYRSEYLPHGELSLIQRDWRLLARLGCDLVVPVESGETLEALLCLRAGKAEHEDWEDYARLLDGVGQILADQLQLLRLGQERERERHLGELGLMAAGLAHEIKNPLEGVYGAAQILQEEGKGNPRFVGMVLRESLRLNDVVHGFLRYARPYAAEPRHQELAPLLKEWEEAGCLVQVDPAGLSARVDATAFHQILLNLVENARRVQPREEPIRLNAVLTPAWVEVSCIDQGGGVPEERLDRLFEPFATGHESGNGLGLALSRKMARAMGGDLLYKPVPGGAEFCLLLKKSVPNAA